MFKMTNTLHEYVMLVAQYQSIKFKQIINNLYKVQTNK